MRGLDPRIHLQKRMDCRVKPGNDETVDNREHKGLTLAIPVAISTPPGTSGLLAFGWMGENDGNDTIKRWPRRPPQAAFVPLLASRHP
jgi:hypothetical protein